jgi:hypothetical protein
MNPYSVALWITKFVATLALLLVAIPAGLFFGGAYAVAGYQEHKAVKVQRAKDCSAYHAQLQDAFKQEKDTAAITGLPDDIDGLISEPLGRAGVEMTFQNREPLLDTAKWVFEDGSKVPFSQYVADTQKTIKAVCEN